MMKRLFIFAAALVALIGLVARAQAASEIEDYLASELKMTFTDAPATAPGRERRIGKSTDGQYVVELIGKPNPHTVTMMAGVTKRNADDVLDIMAQSAFVYLSWSSPRPWLEKALVSALKGKPLATGSSKGPHMEMTSMMPAMPLVSLVMQTDGRDR